MLSQATSWPHISTGDLLRKHIAAGSQAGLASQQILHGEYAPDEVVNQLVAERMAGQDCRNGVVLDGYPRTLEQIRLFLPALEAVRMAPIVVRLKVDYNEISRRLEFRRNCSFCGAIYNTETLPPQAEGICDVCGHSLVARPDDRSEVIAKRLGHYAALTTPVETLLREKMGGRWIELNGAAQPADLLNSLLGKIRKN